MTTRGKMVGVFILVLLVVGLIISIKAGDEPSGPDAVTENGIVAASSSLRFDLQKVDGICGRKAQLQVNKKLGHASPGPSSRPLSAEEKSDLDGAITEVTGIVKRYRNDPAFDGNLRRNSESIAKALSDCDVGARATRLNALLGRSQ